MGGPLESGANYGTKGVASVLNYPGNRVGHTTVFHALSNSMLLFGGYVQEYGSTGSMNDLWSIPLNFTIKESISAKVSSKYDCISMQGMHHYRHADSNMAYETVIGKQVGLVGRK